MASLFDVDTRRTRRWTPQARSPDASGGTHRLPATGPRPRPRPQDPRLQEGPAVLPQQRHNREAPSEARQGRQRPVPAMATPQAPSREALLAEHLPLVARVARGLKHRLPSHVEYDDLHNEGVLGLLDAVERYDASRGVAFPSFAARRIQGAMLDMLRSLDWVPRSVRDRAEEVRRVRTHLTESLGRDPRPHELASGLGLSEDDLADHLGLAEIRTLTSLEAPCDGPGSPTLGEVLPDPHPVRPDELLHDRHAAEAVRDAVAGLPRRERQAVQGYYLEGHSLTAVGQQMGVSASRVSQLHQRGVDHLGRRLSSDLVA